MVHLKLDVLKKSIDDAFGAAMRPAGGLSYNQSDLRLTHNLRKLLDAAKQFHSTASSTASTIRDGTNGHWMSHNNQAMSLMGEFPPNRRQWVEDYVRAGRHWEYHSPDALGQQSPRRAISPRRPRSPSGSPQATSFAAIDEVTAKTPTDIVPDKENGERQEDKDEEDDEDYDDDNAEPEAEKAFQDRLRELALDRIGTRDYSNAVVFLQRALKPVPVTDIAKAEHRHLKIQLAVCYFLQRDWGKAEAIVSILSKTKSDRDSVICTLMHALSLAHLFHYSFESALSIGQRALQGRKRLFKAGSIESSEVDKTRALLATIYDVRGGDDDYIHADVLNGQLTRDFEYNHPKSEIEFLTNHPTLFSTVFGHDTPALGPITPSGHVELPGDALGLEVHAKQPVNNDQGNRLKVICTLEPTGAIRSAGGVSPLRSKLTDHWRFEQDTAKCATSSPMPAPRPLSPRTMDADDECSTNIDTPTFPLKHRLTHLLTYRRTRPVKLEDVPDSAEPPIATTSPTSNWLRGGSMVRRTKSKKLVRKRSKEHVPERQRLSSSFRFHSKKGINQAEATGSDKNGSRVLDWLESQTSCENSEDCASVVACVGSSRASMCWLPGDHLGPDALSSPHTLPCTLPEKTKAFSQYSQRNLPSNPYTPDDMVPIVDTDRHAHLKKLGGNIYYEFMNGSICPELMDTGLPAELSDTALTPVEIIERHPSIGHNARHSLRSSLLDAGLREKSREPDSATTSSASFQSRPNNLKLRTTGLENTHLEYVPGQLAGHFAALPHMTDERERFVTKLSLDRLLSHVTSAFRDPVLEHDIRRIIKKLEKNGSPGADTASDSGYETMSAVKAGPNKSPLQFDSGAEDEHNNTAVPLPLSSEPSCRQDSPRSHLTDKPASTVRRYSLSSQTQTYPGLKRAFSFVVGAEDDISCNRSGAIRQDDEDDSAQPSTKKVSFALEPDPQDELATCKAEQSDNDGGKEGNKTGDRIDACGMEMESCKQYREQRRRVNFKIRDIWGKISLGRKALTDLARLDGGEPPICMRTS